MDGWFIRLHDEIDLTSPVGLKLVLSHKNLTVLRFEGLNRNNKCRCFFLYPDFHANIFFQLQ